MNFLQLMSTRGQWVICGRCNFTWWPHLGSCICTGRRVGTCLRCGMPWVADLLTGSSVTIDRDLPICGYCRTDEEDRDENGLAPAPSDEWPVSWMSIETRLYADALSALSEDEDEDKDEDGAPCCCDCLGCNSELSHCSESGIGCNVKTQF